MNDAFSNYARLGLIHFMAFPQVMKGEGFAESVDRLAGDPDFEVVEVTTMPDEALRMRAARTFSAAGMTLAFGAQPVILGGKLNLNAESEADRSKAVERLKSAIDEAYAIGAAGFAVLSGPDPGEAKRKAAMQSLERSLVELCAYSASKGDMPVVLETFDRVSFGKNALIGPTAEAVPLARSVRSKHPSFGLMLDLSHLPLLGESAASCLGAARDVLAHVHIGNCVMRDASHPAYGDNHPRFGIEGGENGAPQLAEFLRALLSIGYLCTARRRIVSFEVKPLPGESSELVIANAKRTLAAAWRMV